MSQQGLFREHDVILVLATPRTVCGRLTPAIWQIQQQSQNRRCRRCYPNEVAARSAEHAMSTRVTDGQKK